MVPGGGAMHLDDSLGARDDIKFVCNLHEQAAAIAAEAYARSRTTWASPWSRPGPAARTRSPAWRARGSIRPVPRHLGPGEAGRPRGCAPACASWGSGDRHRSIVEPDHQVRRHGRWIPRRSATISRRRSTCARRAGPVPCGSIFRWTFRRPRLIRHACRFDALRAASSSRVHDRSLRAERVRRSIELLTRRSGRCFWSATAFGLPARRVDSLQLVDMLDIPVLTTWMGADLLPGGASAVLRQPGRSRARGANFALAELRLPSDSIGARLDLGGYRIRPGAVCARRQEDHGRYRSGRNQQASRCDSTCRSAPTSARSSASCSCDVGDRVAPTNCGDWFGRCADWKRRIRSFCREYRDAEPVLSIYVLSRSFRTSLAGDVLVSRAAPASPIDTFLLAFAGQGAAAGLQHGGLGAMGFGLPAAIGGCLASGRRVDRCVDGDGGFQLNIQELETVARLNLPIKFFQPLPRRGPALADRGPRECPASTASCR